MFINFQILNRSILFIVGVLFQANATGQVFVGADTNIYVNNEVVYIKQELELSTASSNFYLRNSSQFLQGTTGSGTNKGVGALSVFQEGTVDEFQFNYWCSPVGNVTVATSVNNPFGIIQLGIPATTVASTPVSILAMDNFNGTTSPFAIAPYWIAKLLSSSSYYDWIKVGSDYSIEAGEGFTMKGTAGTDATTVNGVQNNRDGKSQRYDFRGKPNDGTINIFVLPEELTLTGNPYPSAIDLQAFLKDKANINCSGIAYFWEHDKEVHSHYIADYKGGYGTYSPAGGINGTGSYVPATFYSYDGLGNQVLSLDRSEDPFERKYSPIGQGFMIEGNKTQLGGAVQMKNSYRVFVKEGVENLSKFGKKRNGKGESTTYQTPQIKFNVLLDNGPVSQILLIFDPLSTDGVDRAMDAASANDGPANSYFVINDNEYVIQVMPFNVNKKIPIGFRNSTQANYKITVNEMLNLSEVANVYLHDKVANVYHDIKNNFFNLTLPAGTYNTQYEITFSNGVLGIGDFVNQSFLVQQNNVEKNLTIYNPLHKELTSYSLYDIAGKLIFSKNQLGIDSFYLFSTSGLSDGIYIVKLSTIENVEMGTKIIVKN